MDSAVTIESPLSKHGSQDQAHHADHRLHLDSQSPPLLSSPPPHTKFSGDSPGEKGHAHDPMDDEPLFLGIGTGRHSHDHSTATSIAESPTAAEFSIYDTAYQNEVERIRAAQGHKATVYLTRRVDTKKEYQMDDNMAHLPKSDDVKDHAHGGFMNIVEKAREQGKEQFNGATKNETFKESESQKEKATATTDVDDRIEGKEAVEEQSDADTPLKMEEETPGSRVPSAVEIKSRGKKLSELVDRAQEGLRKRGKEGNVKMSGLIQKVSSMGKKSTGNTGAGTGG